ncbi:hypothetical protein F511_39923 [Dorcoceras hygrometricum]|uniref:Uncharacterized protein n=1 Tax=Dorcoceras hygrometricum TaxID=472368 RepID=A0A2Z7C787_9LAMI|nr:hypothetical protein F511_39923 [Dorcoceras hygrometricum]
MRVRYCSSPSHPGKKQQQEILKLWLGTRPHRNQNVVLPNRRNTRMAATSRSSTSQFQFLKLVRIGESFSRGVQRDLVRAKQPPDTTGIRRKSSRLNSALGFEG